MKIHQNQWVDFTVWNEIKYLATKTLPSHFKTSIVMLFRHNCLIPITGDKLKNFTNYKNLSITRYAKDALHKNESVIIFLCFTWLHMWHRRCIIQLQICKRCLLTYIMPSVMHQLCVRLHHFEIKTVINHRQLNKWTYSIFLVSAVVVPQLAKHLLPMSEVCGSNPVIGQNLYRTCLLLTAEKTKIKEKRMGMAHWKTIFF